MSKFLDFDGAEPNKAELVNNYDWMKDFTFLDFARVVGKHITVNYMMAKDSVQKRLNGEARDGLSFTEFTYQLLQGYDFLYQYEKYGVRLQLGGNDQWGNMTTGTELIHRTLGNDAECFCLTCPLITKADGKKFGKTESGNIWLDRNRTTPYAFYQFWLNVSDDDAEKYIKIFTDLDKETIDALVEEHKQDPGRRVLQKRLAEEVTVMVHSQEDLDMAIAASNILFTVEAEAVSDSPVFTTVNGSNSVVVNSLAPGASDTLTIKFSSSPTAEQRSYTITINEQYDSPEFKNAKEAVKIAVGLKQEARLNTGTIEVMPDAISVGEESNVMFSINNTGKVMLYNVNAVFEADSIQKNEAYVGNIEPGKSGNVDTMINGIAPTMDDGKVKLSITYEDENGKVSTVEKEIQLMVNEDQSMDESNVDDTWSSDDIQPEPSTTDKLKHLAIPVGIVGVVLAAVILVVIRRKKKKAGMDDEIL